MRADIKDALEAIDISTEQIQERINELRLMDDDDEEKMMRGSELATWVIGLIAETSPSSLVEVASRFGLNTDEASAFVKCKEDSDKTALSSLGPIATAKKTGKDIYEAFAKWRQTPECWRVITKSAQKSSVLDGSAFVHYINTELNPKVRAELIAKVEIYCQSGWADADLIDGHPDTDKAKALRQVVERIENNGNPPVTPEEAGKAVAERFSELFLNVKIVAKKSELSGEIYIASFVPGNSSFNPVGSESNDGSGSTAGAGFVDIAIKPHPSHKNPACLLVASVSKGNPFETTAESQMKHDSAIRSSVRAGELSGINSIDFCRYVPPATYSDDVPKAKNKEASKDMDDDLRSKANLSVAISDLDCALGDALFVPENFLSSDIHVFGASDPWTDTLKEAKNIRSYDPEAASAFLVKKGLCASRDVLLHLAKITPAFISRHETDKLGRLTVKAAHGLIKAFGNTQNIDEEIASFVGALTSLKNDAYKGTKTYSEIVDNGLTKLTAEVAKEKAEDYKQPKEIVNARKKEQQQMIKNHHDALPQGLPTETVGTRRLAKATFGRMVADTIDGLAVGMPEAFSGNSAKKLATIFRRYAQIADGTLPGMDPNTKGEERTYKQAKNWLGRMRNGVLEIGPFEKMLIDTYIPWVHVNSGDEYNPGGGTPMPDTSYAFFKKKINEIAGEQTRKPKRKC